MPRASKRRDPNLTTFSVVGFLNPKNVTAEFVKQPDQSWWNRRPTDAAWPAEMEKQRRKLMGTEEQVLAAEASAGGPANINVVRTAPPGALTRPAPAQPLLAQEGEIIIDPTQRTIVIHPGSRFLRIGRASDAFPTTVPNAIARKSRNFVPSTSKGKQREFIPPPPPVVPALVPTSQQDGMDLDDDGEPLVDPSVPVDPLTSKINSLRADLRARLHMYKLRGQPNGTHLAQSYNATVQPEATAEYNDPNEIDWTDIGVGAKGVYVGHEAVRIPNYEENGYKLRYPFSRGGFNTTDYTSSQELLGDIERIWLGTLEEELGITKAELKDYSAILIIPDLYDQVYVREMTELILGSIGFKQMCMQQEGLCATFGAGLSNACVIDLGAQTTTISCVEDGMVLSETRMRLDFGGDDITELLHTLLQRISFPYRELDISKWGDWHLIENLKERMIVLSEMDVGLNLYDFYARSPGKKTKKYLLRAYDEVILAPYSLFAPRTVDFDKKNLEQPQLWSKNVSDFFEIGANATTLAMKNSTKSLITAAPVSIKLVLPVKRSATPADSLANDTVDGVVAPPLPAPLLQAAAALASESTPTQSVSPPPTSTKSSARQPTPSATTTNTEIDVKFEAGKIALHIAVMESILAAGTPDRQKKLSQNVLLVGGTALIHNVGFAIESRTSPILTTRAPHLNGTFSIVPSPRELDPKILAWKGMSALCSLESTTELWVRRDDWELMGLRALRERHYFM